MQCLAFPRVNHPHKKNSLLKPDTLFKIAGGEAWRPHAEGSRGGKLGGSIKTIMDYYH